MTKRDDRTGQGSELRRRAEEVVLENAARSPGKQAPLLPEEMREALHDLQVHQIELKMQNLELLRSHVELDAARARYFDLYDLAPVGYLTLSEEGVILEANHAAATLLGVARGTLVWQLFNRFVFKEDQDSYYLYGKQHFKSDTELREEPVEGGATFRQSSGGESAQLPGCELRMVKKDGTPFWVHLAATATQGKDGTPEYRVVLTDINKRKEEDVESLRENEARFNQLADQSGIFIWEVDARGLFTYVSPTSEAVLGYRPDELIGRPFHDLHPESGREALKQAAFFNIKLGEPFQNYRNSAVSKDGRLVWLSTNGLPLLDADGTVTGYRGSDTDITVLKRAEEAKAALEAQLLQAQKMESVGHLAGGVAHDFNNMLSVITNYAALAVMKLEVGDSAPSIVSCLTEIRQAAEHSGDITRQLLAFARKQIVTPVLLDLGDAVGGMLKMLQRLIGEEIDISWQTEGGLWTVKVDPGQIDQILANLCVNARDAISGVGRITIETGNIVLEEVYCAAHVGAVPGEYVRLAVSDTGCGMEKEILRQIFEPFFTTKGIGRGTGLGLATVYGIVKQNNGFLEVRSEPGQGTTFTIYFPRHAVETGEKRHEVRDLPVRGHETILLVEDEPAILKSTAIILEMQGYNVLTASTPGNAIRLAEEQNGAIHLLLTDVVMPEMNGQELARKLLVLYPHLKRIFMSGYSGDIIALHGVLIDNVHFIEKPFSLSGLITKVREALESN